MRDALRDVLRAHLATNPQVFLTAGGRSETLRGHSPGGIAGRIFASRVGHSERSVTGGVASSGQPSCRRDDLLHACDLFGRPASTPQRNSVRQDSLPDSGLAGAAPPLPSAEPVVPEHLFKKRASLPQLTQGNRLEDLIEVIAAFDLPQPIDGTPVTGLRKSRELKRRQFRQPRRFLRLRDAVRAIPVVDPFVPHSEFRCLVLKEQFSGGAERHWIRPRLLASRRAGEKRVA